MNGILGIIIKKERQDPLHTQRYLLRQPTQPEVVISIKGRHAFNSKKHKITITLS